MQITVTLLAIGWSTITGCGTSQNEHGHDPGTNGGIVVSVGNDHQHVEALFVDGELHLHTLGQDQSQIITVPVQELVAYIRSPQSVESVGVKLAATPQPGDPSGQTSKFVGKIPQKLIGADVIVVVPSLQIGTGRHRISFMTQAGTHDAEMPTKVTDSAERELYLKPGGVYTAADIQANGAQTASDKYKNFNSAHDMHPKAGDRICPITHTKANPQCTWIVGGKEYMFCCPPCIDEFVKQAKESPGEIQLPEKYLKQ